MKNAFVLLAGLISASAAFSQPGGPAVGSVSNVNGLVTITQNNQLVNASNGATFSNGANIVSTATGRVTVQMNGCSVTLQPNQALRIDSSLSCDKIQAAVVNLPPPPGGFGGPVVAGGGGSGGAGLGVIGFGVLTQYKAYKDTPASLR